jgi:hypothetical protein
MATQQEEGADVFLASVSAQEPSSIFALLSDSEIDFGCRPALRRAPDGVYQIALFATERKLNELRDRLDLTIEVVRNASAYGRRRQEEVGQGDRFDSGKVVPYGSGRKLRPGMPDSNPTVEE